MSKLIEKVLTEKTSRDAEAMKVFARSTSNVGVPWAL